MSKARLFWWRVIAASFMLGTIGWAGAAIELTSSGVTVTSVLAAINGQAITPSSVTTTGNIAASGNLYGIGPNGIITSGIVQVNGTNTLQLFGTTIDGASAVNAFIDTAVAYVTGGAKILSIRNNGVEKTYVDLNGAIKSGAAATAGCIALSGGTQTVTVLSGAHCVCTLSISAGTAAPKCSVSGTTLTITGTGTDTECYTCL